LFENLSVNSLKGDLSNATTFNPPLFSMVNTFKTAVWRTFLKLELAGSGVSARCRQYWLIGVPQIVKNVRQTAITTNLRQADSPDQITQQNGL
jgi:hypothetical protein